MLKTGNGEKLERWGNIILNRPDPQIIWEKKMFGIIMMDIIIVAMKVAAIGNTKKVTRVLDSKI